MFVLVAVLAAVVACTIGAAPAGEEGGTNPKQFLWAQGQRAPGELSPSTVSAAASDLIYGGGNVGAGAIGVQVIPAVYLIYWGSEWAAGFTTLDSNGTPYSSTTLQDYVNSFMTNVGGSNWAGVQTQYCRNVPAGTTNCKSEPGAEYVTNPVGQLKGVWTDPAPVPDDIATLALAQSPADDPIAAEALRASAHFNHDATATYIVLTPPKPSGTGQPVYCGYHSQTTSVDASGNSSRIEYAFIPFLNAASPSIGTGGCGMNNVNATNNAFGNGVFDGYSIVVGHEYAEAVTDPDYFSSSQDGWNDASGSENGDKCEWVGTQNITLGGREFAVQPLWSNEAFAATGNGCVVAR